MQMIRRFLFGVLVCLVQVSAQGETEPSVIQISPEALEDYEFEIEESPFKVSSPSVGQRFIFDRSRRNIKDLLARHIGTTQLLLDETDLKRFQILVDRKAIRSGDVETWQALGVVFGDVLVEQHGLHWVMYEDELGASKALRWQESDNFVFPVTVFSKRVQFNETIDVLAIYEKIASDIDAFKVAAAKPRMPERRATQMFGIDS